MKKIVLRVMAWLLVVAMMMPFAGNNVSAQAATYAGDYASGYLFTAAEFEGIAGEATIKIKLSTTGEYPYYQFKFYKNVDGWPSVPNSAFTKMDIEANSYEFIPVEQGTSELEFVLAANTVKELQTEYSMGIQVYGVIIEDVKVSGAAPAPTKAPEPTKAPAAPAPTKAPAAPTKAPEPTKAPAFATVGDELVVTKAMVKNGTVTVENAKYNKVIIPRNIDARSVYFANVSVATMEVESGADYVITISDSTVDALNVKAPVVSGITRDVLLTMIENNVTIAEETLLAYKEYEKTVKGVAKLQPIINASGTTLDKITVSSNAKLIVTGCDVLVDAKAAEEALDVELVAFTGAVNVAVDGSADNGYALVNLELTNSNAAEVTVSGNDGSCVIDGNSKIEKVKVSGNNAVTVSVDAKEISVDSKAENATVRVYGAVNTVNAAGKKNAIVLGSAASVKNANVTGSDIKVYGYGKLETAEVTGTGANIAVTGAEVEGDYDDSTPAAMKAMNPMKELEARSAGTPVQPGTSVQPGIPDEPSTEDGEDLDITGATLCDTNGWQVHHFTDKDLRDYAGKTVNFSVDMAMVSEEDSVKVYTQINCDPWTCVANDAVITGEWKTFSYSYDVPAEFSDSASAVNLGYRWISGPNDDYADYKFYFKNYTFSVEGEGGTPTTPPTEDENKLDLTGAEECDTNDWQVHHFTDEDLRDYAGKTVNFTVDMAMISEEDSVEVFTQINCDPWTCVAGNAVITGEWKTFSYSYDVPAEFADSANAVNLGYRWQAGPNSDYTNYKFYYKNYEFTVTEAEEGGNGATVEPAYVGFLENTDEG